MEKTISSNQAGLMLVIFTIALKLSALPALVGKFSGNDSYIVCFFALLFDFIGTIIIISVMKKMPDKNFFTLIEENLSRAVAIIVFLLLAIYFLIKCVVAMLELHDYFISTLFDDLNPIFFIIIITLFLLYMFNKNFRTIGRMVEVCFWPMFIGISFSLLFPIGDVELTNLLPIFDEGVYPLLKGFVRTSFAFGDFTLLLIFMGNISIQKNSPKKIILYMISGLSFIFNFYIEFIGTFGNTVVNQTLAIGELPLHNPYPTTVGRLEWITIIIWTAILLIQATLLGKCTCVCLNQVFKPKKKRVLPIVISLALFVISSPLYLKLQPFLEFLTSEIVSYISIVFHILLIVILLTCVILIKLRKNKSNKIYQSTREVKNAKSMENAN